MENKDLTKIAKLFKSVVEPKKKKEEVDFKTKALKEYEKTKEASKKESKVDLLKSPPKKLKTTGKAGTVSANQEQEIMNELFDRINKRLETSDSISKEVMEKIKNRALENLKDKFVDDKDSKRRLTIEFILTKLSRKQLINLADLSKKNGLGVQELLQKYLNIDLDAKTKFLKYMNDTKLLKEDKKIDQMLELSERNELAQDILLRKTLLELYDKYEKSGDFEVLQEPLLLMKEDNEFIRILLSVLGKKSIIQFLQIIKRQPLDYSSKFGDSVEIVFLNFVSERPKLLELLNENKGDYDFKRKVAGKPTELKKYKYVDDEGEQFEFVVPIKRQTKILLTTQDGESVNIERDRLINIVKKTEVFNKYALQDYNLKLWVPNYSSTWVAAPVGEQFDFSFVNSEKSFIFTDTEQNGVIIEGDGLKYYKTNNLFNMMQINNYSNKRTQLGNVLVFYDMNGNMKKVHVIYKQRNGNIIVQNEELFEREKEWLKLKNADFKLKLEILLNKKVKEFTNNMSIFTDNILTEYISKNLDLPVYNEVCNNIVDAFKQNNIDKTLRELLQSFVNVMIYINKDILGVHTNRFTNQLKLKYYKYDSIPLLDEKNILPEVYTSDDEQFITTFIERIELYKNYLLLKIGTQIYAKLNPYDKSTYLPTPPILEIPKISDFEEICYNQIDIPKYKIVTYKEGDKTYCFDIIHLIDRLRQDISDNPFTNQEFDVEFIDYLNTFDGSTFVEAVEEEVLQEPDEFETDPFLEALYSEISKLEEKMLFGEDSQQEVEQEVEQESQPSVVITPVPVQDEQSQPSVVITSIQDGSQDEEIKEKVNLTEKGRIKPMAFKLLEMKSPSSLKQHSCHNCNKDVSCQLKTIVKNDDVKVVQFCDINCFEEWSEPDI